ncbi:MAG: hypothetical protein IKW83_04735 [Muribaculaceae bacterium]|nr:hypothetical protein [Muribaculaceae bacterium]
MTLLKLLEQDLRCWIEQGNKRILFNERDFQLQLAMWLLKSGNYDAVELEYHVPAQELNKDNDYVWVNPNRKKKEDSHPAELQEMYLDIVVEKDSRFAIVELKYPTKIEPIKIKRFGDSKEFTDILKNQGADNIVKYNFWKDVRRIELVKRRFNNVVGGFAFMLTNDRIYQVQPKADTYKLNFSMAEKTKDGRTILHCKDKSWVQVKGKDTSLKEHLPDFKVDKEYETPWNSTLCDDVEFYYTIVRID